MPSNLEIKTRLQNPEKAMKIAETLAGKPPEIIQQDDVFYSVHRGRLKLRTLDATSGELIFYDRPDQIGPAVCEYTIAPTSDPAALDAILCQTLGARGRIRKTRRLYQVARTRIHIDDVENLGHFLELEVVLEEGEAAEAGHAEADRLMKELDISDDDLIEYAYIDLLEMELPEQ